MKKVAILTEAQRDELLKELYSDNSFFNPIKDINDNWVISSEEIEFCTNDNFNWVKNLPMIDYVPKPLNNLIQ